MERNMNVMQVNSGQLLKHSPFLKSFAESPALNEIVNKVVNKSYQLSVCPGDPSTEYSLIKSDFGFKINYYDGDQDSGIGWHFDKNHSWKDDTIVVIYNILFRQNGSPSSLSPLPTCYEIIENGRNIPFSIPENSLHIHDTNNIFHRAVTPKGYTRVIFILHFTKSPCVSGPKRNGFTPDLILRNVFMRLYVEIFVQPLGQSILAILLGWFYFLWQSD